MSVSKPQPASICISGLSWSLPDGKPLFSRLNLSFGPVRTGLVGRNGVGKTSLLHLISRDLSPHSGNVTCVGALGMLRQSVQVNEQETIADLFGMSDELDLLARAERGLLDVEGLLDIDWTLQPRAEAALSRLGLERSFDTRLQDLSGGQRTRAMMAALIFSAPDFILLDEPTNNLDQAGREVIVSLLAAWKGGAIVVSHDRDLLETMDQIVELTSLGAKVYGGNWSHYRSQKAAELAAAQRDLSNAEQHLAEVNSKAQQANERKARRDKAGKQKRARGDMPKVLLNQRRDTSEKSGGAQSRLADRLRDAAGKQVETARQRLETLQPFSISLAPTGLATGQVVLRAENLSGGYDADVPIIRDFSLTLVGPERCAITGNNGAGKTTLLKLIRGELAPFQGSVQIVSDFALLDQQISVLDPALSIRENFLRHNPDADENTCRAALARFRFRADAALQIAGNLSGGEMLRAGLACIIGGHKPPRLLILDEPTNHLDIEAIETVEAGLQAYDGALLVASHDPAFLNAIGITRSVHMTPKVPKRQQ